MCAPRPVVWNTSSVGINVLYEKQPTKLIKQKLHLCTELSWVSEQDQSQAHVLGIPCAAKVGLIIKGIAVSSMQEAEDRAFLRNLKVLQYLSQSNGHKLLLIELKVIFKIQNDLKT